MKKILYLLCGAMMVTGTFVSCDLDSMSMTEKDTSNFPANEKDANQALAAIYQNLNAVNANPQQSFFYLSMLASDDNLGGGGTNDKLMQALDLLLNNNANMTEQFYKDRYQGINRANTLIQALSSVALDEAIKLQTMGEAKFLRAFYYYELASMYGRVPLVTTPTVPKDPTPPASSVIWGQILQDLYEAATTMPAVRKTNGHVDRYGAAALLGRAWLFYTGFYCNGETTADLVSSSYKPLTSVKLPNGETLTKEQVITCIDDCVNNSGYSLVQDFRCLWAYTNRFTVEDYPYTAGKGLKWVEDDNGVNPESMFAIKYNKLADWATTIGYGNGYALHFGIRAASNNADYFPFGQGWGAGPVSPNLVQDWEIADKDNKDIRRSASLQNASEFPHYTFGGGGDWVQETGYIEKKLLPVTCKDKTQKSGYACCFENLMYGTDGWLQGSYNMQLNNIHDLVLIRFADVLLMQSELKEDVQGINKVRARAGLTPLTAYSLEALQQERRWELCFEGVRWNDIRRWHIASEALDKQLNKPIYTGGAADKNVAVNGGYSARYKATAGFQKKPENQVTLSNGTLTQNDGWGDASSEYAGWVGAK
ncbi:RagB/SusD family nutrient uptake outer membrane protein [Bacteroidaceae bacterium HV4-6-C5C]|nr:RagB/SusD family nutrient uptake outer membrane protein [Bacteroidaceae bacterium HV4-6-C5C]